MAAGLIGLKLHKYDIAADLGYAFPRQDIVVLPAQQPEKLGSARRYEGYEPALALVKLRVADVAQAPAGLYINNFLIPKLGKITYHIITRCMI